MGCGALRAAEERSYELYEVAEGGLLTLSGDESLDQRMRLVTDAVRATFTQKNPNGLLSNGAWPRETFDDYVVYDLDGKLFSVDYEIRNGVVAFTSEPMAVRMLSPSYVPENSAANVLKMFEEFRAAVGKRHSASDQKMLQTVHDHAVSLGAECGPKALSAAWDVDALRTFGPMSDGAQKMKDCPHCDGMGQMGKKDCPYCDGEGKVRAASSWLGNLKDAVVGLFKPELPPVRWAEDADALKSCAWEQRQEERAQTSPFAGDVAKLSFTTAKVADEEARARAEQTARAEETAVAVKEDS